MLLVAGLTLKNLHPRVWDKASPYYLANLKAVMVSYAEFDAKPNKRLQAMEKGLREFLGVPVGVAIYLDNGAFAFMSHSREVPRGDYEAFIGRAKPDWYAIPQDYIPSPGMTDADQRACLQRTMAVNRQYAFDGYVPVIHASRLLNDYLRELQSDPQLTSKVAFGLGGLVPNLLRAPKAVPYQTILDGLRHTRRSLDGKQLHVFGVGGTATLHLAALLQIDSLDSSGWRNRAARGLIQLPGRGDRMVADLGSWRGRVPSEDEWKLLEQCACPACAASGVAGLRAQRLAGFCNRATHNLWTLLQEEEQISAHLQDGSYPEWFERHLDNSIYLPLIRHTLKQSAVPEPTS